MQDIISNRSEAQKLVCIEINQIRQIDSNAIFDLFDLIHAPEDLRLIFTAIASLIDILNAAIEIADLSGIDCSRYQEAARTVATLNEILPDLQNHSGLKHPRGSIYELMLGDYVSPLYYLIIDALYDRKLDKQFIYLKAQALIATQSIVQPGVEFPTSVSNYFNCIIGLNTQSVERINSRAQQSEIIRYLSLFPRSALSTTDFLNTIKKLLVNTKFEALIKLFRLSASGHVNKHKETTQVARKKQPAQQKPDDDEEVSETYLGKVLPSTVLTETESEAFKIHGGIPDELGLSVSFEAILDNDRYHGPTRRMLAFQAKQASNHRAMLNQFSAIAWNQANSYDVRNLFDFLDGSNQLDESYFNQLSREDAIALLGLMFFTCSSFERILALPVYSYLELNNDEAPEGVYCNDAYPQLVRLFSPGPKLKNRDSYTGRTPTDKYVNVPLPPFFSHCFDSGTHSFKSSEVRPFLLHDVNPKNVETAREIYFSLRSILGEINRRSRARLSLGRISSYLLFRLAESSNCDLPGAMLFFGRDDKITQTRVHYSLVFLVHLESKYRECCNKLLVHLDRQGLFLLDQFVNAESYIGTPLCPTSNTVKNLATKLQLVVESSRGLSLAEFHKLYTLYTSMLIAFGTGFRAIRDPSFREVEVDFEYGIGIIADKGDSNYNSRYVYLAPVVLDQINYYRQHIQVIYGMFGVKNPSLFNMVKNLSYEGLPLNLILIKGEQDPVKILTPDISKSILTDLDLFTTPINSGRHYLKLQLLDSGCSPELVEAQLGHWENGQEPWGYFSNLDPLDFAEQLSGYIPQILKRDGWIAVKGLQ